MLEFSDWEFKTTMIKMLRTLLGRQHVEADGQSKQRVREILRKNEKEMLEIRSTVTEMLSLIGLLVDWTQLRKASLSLTIYQ